MKILNKITLLVLSFAMFLVSTNVSVSSVSAADLGEQFYLKGAEYSKTLSRVGNSSADLGGSTVVVSAATTWDGTANGKARIRAWTRNAYIANYYDAKIVQTNYVSVSLGSPAVINLLVTKGRVLPEETVAYTSVPGVSYFMKGILAPAYELSLALLPAFNGQVSHNFQDNMTGVSIKMNADNGNFELPSTVGFKDGDKYYNGVYNKNTKTITKAATAKGTSAYVAYEYHIPQTGGVLTASAIAQYEVRIFNDPVSGIPLIFAANTGKASVNFTIAHS